MSRTQRTYNTPAFWRHLFGYSNDTDWNWIIRWKQVCMGHCRSCRKRFFIDAQHDKTTKRMALWIAIMEA